MMKGGEGYLEVPLVVHVYEGSASVADADCELYIWEECNEAPVLR